MESNFIHADPKSNVMKIESYQDALPCLEKETMEYDLHHKINVKMGISTSGGLDRERLARIILEFERQQKPPLLQTC
jgi:hypothetical protein